MESLGVNVHLSYTDGRYAAFQSVIDDLKYLGIDQVRDAAPNPARQGQGAYGRLAQAGVRFDMIVGGGRPIAESMSSLHAFAEAHHGAVIAVEGPNEINNWPISYDGKVGADAGVAFQAALYAAVKADPALAGVSVYNLTGTYAVVSGYDFVSLHPYPSHGAQPYASMASAMAEKAAHGGSGPTVITEDGYNTTPYKAGSVDPETQARHTLNMVFDAQKVGVSKLFLYQLLDPYPPGDKKGNEQFGLFGYDNSPKPAGTALHNLAAILADPGGEGRSGAATLSYSVADLPATGAMLLYRKSGGAFDLVLWNEPSSENPTGGGNEAVGATQTSITLKAPFRAVRVFDPMAGTSPIASLRDASTVTVSLTDHPLIVEFDPSGR